MNDNNFVNTKPKKWVTYVSLALVGLTMAVALVLAYALPQNKIRRAMITTKAEIGRREGIMGAVCPAGISNMLKNGVYTSDADIAVKDNSISDELNDMSLRVSYSSDKKKQKAGLAAAASYMGTMLADVNAYTDNNDIVIAFPSMYDKAFKLKCSNIMGQYASSPVGKANGYRYNSGDDFSVKIFGEKNERNILSRNYDIYKRLSDKVKFYHNMYFNKALKKAGIERLDNKDIILGEKHYDCIGYRLNVPSDEVQNYIEQLVCNVTDDEVADEVEYAVAEYMYNTTEVNKYYYRDARAMSDEIRELKDKFVQNISDSEFGEMQINYYLCNNRVMEAVVKLPVKFENYEAELRIGFTLNGTDKPVDSFDVSVNYVGSKNNLNITYNDECKTENNVIVQSSKLSISPTNEDNRFYQISGTYNKNTMEISASAESGGVVRGTSGVSVKGRIEPKNDKWTADLSDVNLDVFNQTIRLDILLGVKELNSDISTPDMEAIEIFKVDEASAGKSIDEVMRLFRDVRAVGGFFAVKE